MQFVSHRRWRVPRLGQAVVLAAVLVLGFASASRAQLTFTLSPATRTVAPSGTVSFTGTLTLSAAATQSYDLIGTSANITGPSNSALTVDDNDFLNNLPFTLAPGGTYSRAISVSAFFNAPTGLYNLVYQVDGQGTNNAAPASGVGTAAITVSAASAAAPEPGTLFLILGAGGPIFAAVRSRRRTFRRRE